MARMIPSVIDPKCKSYGEHEIFRRLKDDPVTHDWIVLHSLNITTHVKNLAGEVDFVIIVPAKGVLCLEVKACSRLRRKDGLWYYGSDSAPDPRGPFKQASEGMHSIRNLVTKQRPDLGGVLFWSAVIFPFVELQIISDEWHSWQSIDSRSYRSRSIGTLVSTVLSEARRHVQSKYSAQWFSSKSGYPLAEQCQLIAAVLRPEFESFEPYKVRRERIDNELARYTEDQMEALDAMEVNPRVVFSGPAGTGKTFLALEAARRARSEGRRVLFLCFNRLLGRWLQDQSSDMQPAVTTKTLHRFLMDVSGTDLTKQPSNKDFWEHTLPTLTLEKLLENTEETEYFDEVIVDEAQDIIKDNYLDCIDLVLKGGLASGRWRLFGDFEKQAIYDTSNVPYKAIIEERCGKVSTYSLRTNCRNTPRIAEMAHLLGGLDPAYKRILRPDNTFDPEMYYYHDTQSQRKLLVNCLENLYQNGIEARDIVVISAKSDKDCVASTLDTQPWQKRLCPYEYAGESNIGFCSVQALKGLEASAVIVTDIERVADAYAQSIFYVAVTRSLERLIILVSKSAKQEVIDALIGNAQAQGKGG